MKKTRPEIFSLLQVQHHESHLKTRVSGMASLGYDAVTLTAELNLSYSSLASPPRASSHL